MVMDNVNDRETIPSSMYFVVALGAGMLACRARATQPKIPNKEWHHSIQGVAKTRMTYSPRDFIDYTLMLVLCVCVTRVSFGRAHTFTSLAMLISVFLLFAFALRHGVSWCRSILLSEPVELVRLLNYKLNNVRPCTLICIATLCVEQAIIGITPNWSHMSRTYSTICLEMFHYSFWTITAVRWGIFFAHVWQHDHVFTFLASTSWRKQLGVGDGGRIRVPRRLVHLLQAFATGVLCHILAVAPLYVLITHLHHSVVLAPLRLCVDIVCLWWFWRNDFNYWLYRDHWVCHHQQLAFIYLHAPHHDALPVAFMAAHDTGMLEGFLRFAVGLPETYCSPVLACPLFGVQVLADMVFHQYVPGVFPYSTMVTRFGHHHVEHHFLSLHPLGAAFDHPPDANVNNGTHLDELLAGYTPNNKLWRWFREQVHRIESTNY